MAAVSNLPATGEVVFSDVNINLGQTSSYELLYNEEAVMGAILNILRTRKGTRPFRRDFGSNLLDYVFDPLDNATAMVMKMSITQDIAAYEPRVVIETVEVIPNYDLDAFYVSIVGTLPRLSNRRFDLNFNLPRNKS